MKTDRRNHLLTRTLLAFLLVTVCLAGPYAQPQPRSQSVDSIIIEKNFPFYAHVARRGASAGVLRKDAALQAQTLQQIRRVTTALEQCSDVACYATAVQWTSDEVETIGNRLIELCRDAAQMRPLLAALRADDRYSLYAAHDDAAFVRSVWKDAATGVNRILDTYTKGKKPRYPAIDAISFPENDPGLKEKVRRELAASIKRQAPDELFFALPLEFALEALSMNGRDEAARYEPLDQGLNKSAVHGISRIQWDSFPYSMILVPGQGPEQEGVAIDPMSITRCRLAAERYRKGLAPLIVVSGGHVHPNKTPYSEAVEMKKYMVQELKLPENAILIEPHARHTTTNMRNAARMAYRFGIPETMKILAVTDPIQNGFLGIMERRFMDELRCLPYRDLKKLNDHETEFYPTRNALQANPLDPLDP